MRAKSDFCVRVLIWFQRKKQKIKKITKNNPSHRQIWVAPAAKFKRCSSARRVICRCRQPLAIGTCPPPDARREADEGGSARHPWIRPLWGTAADQAVADPTVADQAIAGSVEADPPATEPPAIADRSLRLLPASCRSPPVSSSEVRKEMR